MYIRGRGAVRRAHAAEPGGGEGAQRMRARRRGGRAGAGPRVWCRPGAMLPGDTHDTHGTPALCHAVPSCASARGRRPAMRSHADALNPSTRGAPRARAARRPPPEACPPWHACSPPPAEKQRLQLAQGSSTPTGRRPGPWTGTRPQSARRPRRPRRSSGSVSDARQGERCEGAQGWRHVGRTSPPARAREGGGGEVLAHPGAPGVDAGGEGVERVDVRVRSVHNLHECTPYRASAPTAPSSRRSCAACERPVLGSRPSCTPAAQTSSPMWQMCR